MSTRSRVLVVIAAVAALTLSGCGSGKTADSKKKSADVTAKKDASLHDQLPQAVKDKGELVMATDPSYPPIESIVNGKTYQGFDIDLANALGKVMGVKIVITKAQFDGILAGINSGRYAFSMSAFTDNSDREKANDFITYFTAGTSIGVKKGNPKNVQTQDDLCGKTVAAEKGTIQLTALTKDAVDGAPTLRGTCVAKKLPVPKALPLPDQNAVNAAVISGRADAFTGDSPIVEYQGKLENGQIQLAGKTTDVGPYGIAVPKGSPLAGIFQKAMTQLIKDGTYATIVKTWGLESGAVTESKINGAG